MQRRCDTLKVGEIIIAPYGYYAGQQCRIVAIEHDGDTGLALRLIPSVPIGRRVQVFPSQKVERLNV